MVDLVRLQGVGDLLEDVHDRAAALRLLLSPGELLGGAHVRLDSRQQLARPERLGDEVRGAQAQRPDGRPFDVLDRGDHQHRQVAEPLVGLDLLEQLQAVDLRHHDVQEQQVRALLLELAEQSFPAGRDHHLVPLVLQDPAEGADQRLVVVGEENLGSRDAGHVVSDLEQRRIDVAPAHDEHCGRDGLQDAGPQRRGRRGPGGLDGQAALAP